MTQKMNHIKYLLSVILSLLFGAICTAQNDTTVSTVLETNLDEPEWYFTDTLISRLNKGKSYKEWNQITVVDQVYPEYLRTFCFLACKRRVKIIDTAGNKLSSFSKRKMDKIILDLVAQIEISDSVYLKDQWPNDPLNQYHLDSSWYKENIAEIWIEYQKFHSLELDSAQIHSSMTELLNYQELYRTLKTPSNWNPDESIMIDLKIEYPFDTLHIQATSYFVYGLPWYYFNNRTRLSNYQVSKLVGALLKLTKQESKNKDRLLGVNFEMILMDDIYNRYLKEKINAH